MKRVPKIFRVSKKFESGRMYSGVNLGTAADDFACIHLYMKVGPSVHSILFFYISTRDITRRL